MACGKKVTFITFFLDTKGKLSYLSKHQDGLVINQPNYLKPLTIETVTKQELPRLAALVR